VLALCFANVYYGLHFGDFREGCAYLTLSVCLRGLDWTSVRDIDEFHVVTITMRHGGVGLNPGGAVAAIIHVIVDSLGHLD
jgi:hypothetical protein